MEREFRLPDLGEGLEEARIIAWLVREGDAVELNQAFVEVETAKADIEIPSPYAGRVAKLHAADGDTVDVGALLVTFDVGEEAGAAPPGGRPATPAARKLARDLGVDLSAIAGTGPEGRITREDVERAGGAPEPKPSAVSVDTQAEEIELTPIRRQIAENLERAYAVPQATTYRTVDCTHLEELRAELGVSPLPVVVRALAETCKEHPLLNASWTDDAILVHRRINVGIATETERGLVVPVVRDADRIGIHAIASEIARLAEAARAGTLSSQDLAGDTITVTNTGSYGGELGTPILKPGNAVTLGLGAVTPRALVTEGVIAARPACTLSVTYDHRLLDGATVGRALSDLVDLLEDRGRLRRLPA